MKKSLYVFLALMFILFNIAKAQQQETVQSDTTKDKSLLTDEPKKETVKGKMDKVAVLNFKAGKGVDKQDSELLTSTFIDELYKTGKYQIMERSQMDAIISEKNLQVSEDFNAETAAAFGASLGVKQVIIGEVGSLGGIYIANIRLVSVESRAILRTSSVKNVSSLGDLASKMTELALIIADLKEAPKTEPPQNRTQQDVPRKQNIVVSSNPNSLYLTCNIWYLNALEINSLGLKTGTMIPAGTEISSARTERIGRRDYIIFKTSGASSQEFRIMFNPGYHKPVTADGYKSRLFSNKNFSELTAGFSDLDIENIKTGKVVVGMSKEAVLVSYGYPPDHGTPSTTLSKWQYWISGTKDECAIEFDSNGKVSAIKK